MKNNGSVEKREREREGEESHNQVGTMLTWRRRRRRRRSRRWMKRRRDNSYFITSPFPFFFPSSRWHVLLQRAD